jgi:DNA-binding response OmpR family regulator
LDDPGAAAVSHACSGKKELKEAGVTSTERRSYEFLMLEDRLGGCGLAVDWVADGHEGMVRAMSGDYDAIMLDRMLLGIGGLTILKAIRAASVETPVMMLSAMGDVDERIRGLRAGSDT